MSSEPAIRLQDLSKKYPIYDRPSDKFIELLTLRRRIRHREFWALRDVDLVVDHGSTVGVIGVNGSGKSTLLQLVAGILQPSSGSCRVNGTVAALLELGAGFNPEFTGRENVFMSGAIGGHTRADMEARFDAIVEFAGIGEFIDQPVKTYSSGMFVRLAFATAIHVEPEILLVDEALAVGDLIFQHRCVNRIRRMQQDGRTILFVTHDLQAVTQFCTRAVLLDGGRLLEDGEPEAVVQRYQELVAHRERAQAGAGAARISLEEESGLPLVQTIPYIHHRYGQGGAEILGIILVSPDGRVVSQVRPGEQYRFVVSVRFRRPMDNPIVGLTIRDRLGSEMTATNTTYEGLHLPPAATDDVVSVGFDWTVPQMRPGSYSVSPAAASGNVWEHAIEDWIDNAYIFDIIDTGLVYGQMRWPFRAAYRRIAGPVAARAESTRRNSRP